MDPDDEEGVHNACKHVINMLAKVRLPWLQLTPELQTFDCKKYTELYEYIQSQYQK